MEINENQIPSNKVFNLLLTIHTISGDRKGYYKEKLLLYQVTDKLKLHLNRVVSEDAMGILIAKIVNVNSAITIRRKSFTIQLTEVEMLAREMYKNKDFTRSID